MLLGIPTLNRYDLLDKLIASAEQGTLPPSGYIIIDNGGSYERPARLLRDVVFVIVRPGRNLGVAASWNKLLELSDGEPIVISNDDIELQPDALEKFEKAFAEGHQFIGACGGWALFGQTPHVTQTIGLYDENFGMAYYEDCDALLRLKSAGIPVHDLLADFLGKDGTRLWCSVTVTALRHADGRLVGPGDGRRGLGRRCSALPAIFRR
jgi:GT2 family glycosyltransferase